MVFVKSKDNFLKLVAEAQLFLTLLISLVLRSDLTGNKIGVSGYDRILVIVTIFMVPLVLVVSSVQGIWGACRNNMVRVAPDHEERRDETTQLA